MSFICQNNTCAIALSKQEFAKQLYDILKGKCPECQGPLLDDKLLSEEDEKLIASLPYVIAYPLKQTLLEKHAWTRINLFKDTFLNYLKYLGLLSASEFFSSDIKDRGMVSLFHQNLTETAFGKWNHYIRETLKFLKEKEHHFYCPELLSYYEQVESGKKVKQYKGEIEFIDAYGDIQHKKQEASAIGMLINFRNKYLGHGQTLDAGSSEKLWNEYFPIFRSLLDQMSFSQHYPMYKKEHGETYLLQSAEIEPIEITHSADANIWIQHASGNTLNILPFFIVPGEVAMTKEDKAQVFTYESYTGKTIKFFSPEGIEKQTSGKILEKLNLLLRDKQKEIPFTHNTFTKEIFLKRIEEENKLLLDTLISEKKIIPGVYQHREQMEIKLREWIGARANIFFIAAEAGSGKTNLLAEIQRQYTERGYPGLLIRAGRMEKDSLKEQVAYLLNIDANEGLDKYTTIAGTQAEPTFILIDGLNEANNAESIWQEIMEWSKIIEPGSIKFVVTSRANTKSDLERYKTEETDLNFLYGENKDHEKGLGAYAFWLTPLDMNEMKGAWENYVAKDKSRYKPLFSFDDIATFDRAIYNQINNPLVLRLFLEIYNGKNLPKKGGNHLHIWQDWFKKFSQVEQTFLKLLADEVWLKGKNELLLDDLLNNEKLKSYLTSDLVNSPYARMKNLGWVSRYVKDMNGCLGFTVEGALLYLLGVKLQKQESAIDLSYIQNTLSTGTKLQQSAIESFLCEQALAGELEMLTELIDVGTEQMELCVRPLLYYLKAYGVEALIEKVLEEPTENDWKVLLKLDRKLIDLENHELKSQFYKKLYLQLPLTGIDSVRLGIKIMSILDNADSIIYLEKIKSISFVYNDPLVFQELGYYLSKILKYNESIEFLQKSLNIYLNHSENKLLEIAEIYHWIGTNLWAKGEYDNAIINYNKSVSAKMELFGIENNKVAETYNNLGLVYSSQNKTDIALDYFKKSNLIKFKYFGETHSEIAATMNNIGLVYFNNGDLLNAHDFFEKSLKINIKTIGEEAIVTARVRGNIAKVLIQENKFDEAYLHIEISLKIFIKYLGESSLEVGWLFIQIGLIYQKKVNQGEALIYFEKSLNIYLSNYDELNLGLTEIYLTIGNYWFEIQDYENSLKYLYKLLGIYSGKKYENYPMLANIYNYIGVIKLEQSDLDNAILYLNKALRNYILNFGECHNFISICYANLGNAFCEKKDYKKAIEYYKKCLLIEINNLGSNHSDLASTYLSIAECRFELYEYEDAIQDYFSGYKIIPKGSFPFGIAKCYEELGEKSIAYNYFIESAKIRIDDPDCGIEDESTIESIENAKRLAKELGRESELPEWIVNN